MAVRRIAGKPAVNDAIASAARRAAYYQGRVDSAPTAAAAVRAKADHVAAELRRVPAQLAYSVQLALLADMDRAIAALVPNGVPT